MSDDRRNPSAADLRAAFDAAFARPVDGPGQDTVALLALRAGGEPVAVRVLETAGIMAARPVVPVPSPRPELLGVSGIRGAVVPIYSLARLLGREDDGAPRWIVLAAAGNPSPDLPRPAERGWGGGERVGLAVSAFERHLVVPAAEVRAAARRAGAGGHAPEVLHAGGEARPVLSVPSLIRAITRR